MSVPKSATKPARMTSSDSPASSAARMRWVKRGGFAALHLVLADMGVQIAAAGAADHLFDAEEGFAVRPVVGVPEDDGIGVARVRRAGGEGLLGRAVGVHGRSGKQDGGGSSHGRPVFWGTGRGLNQCNACG